MAYIVQKGNESKTFGSMDSVSHFLGVGYKVARTAFEDGTEIDGWTIDEAMEADGHDCEEKSSKSKKRKVVETEEQERKIVEQKAPEFDEDSMKKMYERFCHYLESSTSYSFRQVCELGAVDYNLAYNFFKTIYFFAKIC